MKAAYITECGSIKNIQYGDVDNPICRDDEIIVKTICVSVNNVDTFIRSGKYKTPIPFPFIIGRDMVGVVHEIGKATKGFKIGDIVWTNSMGYDGRQGVTSEFVSVNQDRLYHLPEGVDPISAVASLHSSATAAILLAEIGKARIGEKILIQGAAGHVGRKLVSLAKQMGLSITTTSNPDDFEILHKLGADNTIDYKETFPSENQREVFDLIVDTSGKANLQNNITALNIGGRILMITPAPIDIIDTWPLYTKMGQILGFVISHASIEQLKIAAEIINDQFKKGLLLDDDVYTLDFKHASQAHELQEKQAKKKPKYVLVF